MILYEKIVNGDSIELIDLINDHSILSRYRKLLDQGNKNFSSFKLPHDPEKAVSMCPISENLEMKQYRFKANKMDVASASLPFLNSEISETYNTFNQMKFTSTPLNASESYSESHRMKPNLGLMLNYSNDNIKEINDDSIENISNKRSESFLSLCDKEEGILEMFKKDHNSAEDSKEKKPISFNTNELIKIQNEIKKAKKHQRRKLFKDEIRKIDEKNRKNHKV